MLMDSPDMFYQKITKGIAYLSDKDADDIVITDGLQSNWWRLKGTIREHEIKAVLTEENLVHHLDDYDELISPEPNDPLMSGKTYGAVSPFISTTAGSIQRDMANQRNILYSPFLTALEFATDSYRCGGYVFYAYVITIGRRAVVMRQFSEEIRELHIYTGFRKYHHEGEIAAKIGVPAIQIEKAEKYEGTKAYNDLVNGDMPKASRTIFNPDYVSPSRLANVRELL